MSQTGSQRSSYADYGALITGQLGHKYASELYGIWLGHAIHLNLFQGERPWDLTGGFTVPEGAPDEIRDGILAFQDRFVSHVAVHILDAEIEVHTILSRSGIGHLLESQPGPVGPHHRNEFTRDQFLSRAADLVGPPTGQPRRIVAVERDHLHIERHTDRL